MKKEEYLIMPTKRHRIRIVHLLMDYTKTHYEICRTSSLYGGSINQENSINNKALLSSQNMIREGNKKFKELIDYYQQRGYKRCRYLLRKNLDNYTEEELVNLYYGNKNMKVLPMRLISSEACALKLFESTLYCSPRIEGVRCMIHFNNNKIEFYDSEGNVFRQEVQDLLNFQSLQDVFKTYPQLIFDGVIYSKDIDPALIKYWAYNPVNISTESINVMILDFVEEIPFRDRIENLYNMIELPLNGKVQLIDYTITKSWIEVERLYWDYFNKGFNSLILRVPNKGYKSRITSSLYLAELQMGQIEEFEVMGYDIIDNGIMFYCSIVPDNNKVLHKCSSEMVKFYQQYLSTTKKRYAKILLIDEKPPKFISINYE